MYSLLCITNSFCIAHFVQELPAASTPIPDTLLFYMEKTGLLANTTELYLGAKVHFRLAVHFPAGITDVTVELFTPDNLDSTKPVMVLCGPTVSDVGTNIDLGVTEVTPKMDASRNDYNVSILFEVLFLRL